MASFVHVHYICHNDNVNTGYLNIDEILAFERGPWETDNEKSDAFGRDSITYVTTKHHTCLDSDDKLPGHRDSDPEVLILESPDELMDMIRGTQI